MARVGRKRKYRWRHKCGQPQRKKRAELVEERLRIARNQPHRRDLKSNDRSSELAESPLGRLRLRGAISEEQYHAGGRFAVIVGEYKSILMGPRATAGSGRGLECRRLCAAAHELLSAEQRELVKDGLFTSEACSCLSRKWRYDDAFAALIGPAIGAGPLIEPDYPPGLNVAIFRAAVISRKRPVVVQDQAAAKAVAKVAIRGEDPTPVEIVNLVRGLNRLAQHFGLTERRPARQYRNAN